MTIEVRTYTWGCVECGAFGKLDCQDGEQGYGIIELIQQDHAKNSRCSGQELRFISEKAYQRLLLDPDRGSGSCPSEEASLDIALRSYIARVIKATRKGCNRAQLWVALGEEFGLGARLATRLCRRFGLDPHEEVGEDWRNATDADQADRP